MQNNEKIAQFASDTFVLSDLLKLVDNSANDNVRVKSLLAVSCKYLLGMVLGVMNNRNIVANNRNLFYILKIAHGVF